MSTMNRTTREAGASDKLRTPGMAAGPVFFGCAEWKTRGDGPAWSARESPHHRKPDRPIPCAAVRSGRPDSGSLKSDVPDGKRDGRRDRARLLRLKTGRSGLGLCRVLRRMRQAGTGEMEERPAGPTCTPATEWQDRETRGQARPKGGRSARHCTLCSKGQGALLRRPGNIGESACRKNW
jgi:hypothetical protein